MTVAAERLATEGPKLRLVELAFDCGYDSQEAFTRAFKSCFGLTPRARTATGGAPASPAVSAPKATEQQVEIAVTNPERILDSWSTWPGREYLTVGSRGSKRYGNQAPLQSIKSDHLAFALSTVNLT
jgi:hypothetical protein